MQPSFISRSQAEIMVATGKSVSFLRDLCGEPAAEPMKWAGLDSALNAASTSKDPFLIDLLGPSLFSFFLLVLL